MKIQDVIEQIVKPIPGAPFQDTVDGFKSGDPEQEVTGIVTTFTASMDVLRKAVDLGANLIITHEPTFYNHWDKIDWLQNNPVFKAKYNFIQEHRLAIWRFHDYWHSHKPDGINVGMLRQLGWEKYWHADSDVVIVPGMTLSELVQHLKARLQISHIRIVGKQDMVCRRIGIAFGAIRGERQIRYLEGDVDTLLCGETVEWQTCEYVRDSLLIGEQKALVIMGHANSEELGMRYLVEWLLPKIGSLPVTFVPAGDPIEFL